MAGGCVSLEVGASRPDPHKGTLKAGAALPSRKVVAIYAHSGSRGECVSLLPSPLLGIMASENLS